MDKFTVLIVDDQMVGRQLLESFLIRENYNLLFAENGEEAFEQAKTHIPDIILLDVMMPKMDGFETTRLIRQETDLKEIPIILVTALDDRDSRLKGLEVGADEYITKPIDRVELITRMKNLLQLRSFRKNTNQTETAAQGSKETETASGIGFKSAQVIKTYKGVSKLPAQIAQTSDSGFFYWQNTIEEKQYILVSNVSSNDSSDLFLGKTFQSILLSNMFIFINQNAQSSFVDQLNTDLQNLVLDQSEFSTVKSFEFIYIELDKVQNSIRYCGINTNMVLCNNRKWNDLNTDIHAPGKGFSVSVHSIDFEPGDFISIITSKNLENLNYGNFMQKMRSAASVETIDINEFANEGENIELSLVQAI